MDIAGVATSMAYKDVTSTYSTAMLAKSLDTMQTAGDGLVKMIENAPAPSGVLPVAGVGENFDMSV